MGLSLGFSTRPTKGPKDFLRPLAGDSKGQLELIGTIELVKLATKAGACLGFRNLTPGYRPGAHRRRVGR